MHREVFTAGFLLTGSTGAMRGVRPAGAAAQCGRGNGTMHQNTRSVRGAGPTHTAVSIKTQATAQDFMGVHNTTMGSIFSISFHSVVKVID